MSSTGTSTSSSRIRQDGCVTRNGHNSAFHIGVSFGVPWLYHWFLYSTLLSHSSIAWAAHGLYNVDGKRPYLTRHIRQRWARPTCRRLGRPLRMRRMAVYLYIYMMSVRIKERPLEDLIQCTIGETVSRFCTSG